MWPPGEGRAEGAPLADADADIRGGSVGAIVVLPLEEQEEWTEVFIWKIIYFVCPPSDDKIYEKRRISTFLDAQKCRVESNHKSYQNDSNARFQWN